MLLAGAFFLPLALLRQPCRYSVATHSASHDPCAPNVRTGVFVEPTYPRAS